jgi:hypothetical protein
VEAILRSPSSSLPRRENAPIRRRRPATTVPDLAFALAAAAWTMAVIFFVGSFFDDDITSGEAGEILARFFAGSLAVAGAMFFLLGVALLRDERGQADHYVVPMAIGVIAGGIEALLFLAPAGSYLWLPFLLLVFALRPLRRAIARIVRGRP